MLRIIFIFIIGLMKPKRGMDIQTTEYSDIIVRGFLNVRRCSVNRFVNSDGSVVYTRYVGEQHVKEDCSNYIPSAKEWIKAIENKERPIWMIRTMDLNIED
jgi:hypothetical protein